MLATHLFYIPLVFFLGMAAGFYLVRALKSAEQRERGMDDDRIARRLAEREQMRLPPDASDIDDGDGGGDD